MYSHTIQENKPDKNDKRKTEISTVINRGKLPSNYHT